MAHRWGMAVDLDRCTVRAFSAAIFGPDTKLVSNWGICARAGHNIHTN